MKFVWCEQQWIQSKSWNVKSIQTEDCNAIRNDIFSAFYCSNEKKNYIFLWYCISAYRKWKSSDYVESWVRLCFCLNCSSIWSFFVVQPLHRLTKRYEWMRNMKLLSIIYQWSQLFVSLLDEKNLLYINVDILLLYQKQLRYGNCDNKDDCELRYFTFFFCVQWKRYIFGTW